jgi:aspartyl-tRNA(Asn)/glutamyl-tRNA(Gln) amidotransferase subunit C
MSKPNFTEKDVARLAELMKLRLKTEEIKRFAKEIPETLSIIDNLNEIQTDKVAPTYQTTGAVNRFQSEGLDERRLSSKEVFQNTKNVKNNLFQIKGITSVHDHH